LSNGTIIKENNNNNNSHHHHHHDKRPPIPTSGFTTPTTRMKLGFKDRHWTEIEKLWRGKAKENPNIETLLKPQACYRSKDRQARARTLPFSSTSTGSGLPTTPITTSVSVSHLGAAVRSGQVPRWPPSPTSPLSRKPVQKTVSASTASPRSQSIKSPMSTTASLLAAHSQAVIPAMSLGRMESPLATRKAIDMLAPHVFNTWQSRDFKSFDSNSISSNESQEEETDHFVELVKAW
jgi:hypothetical protein